MTSGGSSSPRRNSSTSMAGGRRHVGEPAVDEDEPGAAVAEPRRGRRRDDRPEPVTDERRPSRPRARPIPRRPRRRLREHVEVVAPVAVGASDRPWPRRSIATTVAPAAASRRATAPRPRRCAASPWTRTTPGSPAPPQSRKWIRSPGSTTTTNRLVADRLGDGGHVATIGRDAEAPPREPGSRRPTGSSHVPLRAARRARAGRHPARRSASPRRGRDRHRRRADARPSAARTTSTRTRPLRPVRGRAAITEYGADWVALPNRITLFRLPLEEDFPDPDDLAEEVRITVIHELAHHLGIDDDRLDELGVD